MTRKRDMKKQPLKGKIAIITGGSMGIGKETAKEIVLLGGSVCIIARNAEMLELAAAEVKNCRQRQAQFVETLACDATDRQNLEPFLTGFIEDHGIPDYLINVVGFAYPQYVERLTLDDFKKCMDINYYGQLVPILILLPHFIAARKGHIANVSSMMGYFGIMGYAAYAPTKFALVGLTEVLRHELRPYGISFSILYPPDTDTPGFAEENQTKPVECAMMSENVKLMSAEEVAQAFVEGLIKKKYAILPGGAGFVWWMYRHLPGLVRWMIDSDYRKARRRSGKEP